MRFDVVRKRIARGHRERSLFEKRGGIRLAHVLGKPLPGLWQHILRPGASEIYLAQHEALPDESRCRHSAIVQVGPGVLGPSQQRVVILGNEIERGAHRSLLARLGRASGERCLMDTAEPTCRLQPKVEMRATTGCDGQQADDQRQRNERAEVASVARHQPIDVAHHYRRHQRCRERQDREIVR